MRGESTAAAPAARGGYAGMGKTGFASANSVGNTT
jgi:hypothetical protein